MFCEDTKLNPSGGLLLLDSLDNPIDDNCAARVVISNISLPVNWVSTEGPIEEGDISS